MRRMIAAKNRESAVGNSLEQCSHVFFCSQGRVHLEIRIEILTRVIPDRDMMRADLAADLDPTSLRLAQNPDTACGTNMLAMNVMVAEFRHEDIAHDDRFLASAGPARQAEKRAPVTLMDHTCSDEIVILAVIENGEAYHAR